MANENPSRENPSRQQSAERAQTGAAQQGTRASRGGSSVSPYYGGSGYGNGPFSVMRRISDEMDRLFENFGMGRGLFQNESGPGRQWDAADDGESGTSMWSPRVEVCERNGKLLIEADLPGMQREDIHVRVEDDEVIIQGERRRERTQDESGYYRSERSYGSFYRTIPLHEGTDGESANATFRDGVLEITLDAPRQQQRGRTLEIRDAGSGSGNPPAGAAGTRSGQSGGASDKSFKGSTT
jgi:HSP20 family protein